MVPPSYAPPEPPKTSGLAIGSLVLGIIGLGSSLVTLWLLLALFFSSSVPGVDSPDTVITSYLGFLTAPFSLGIGISGVVLGYLGLSNLKQSHGAISGRGLAIAGLVLSYLSITIALAYIVSIIVILVISLISYTGALPNARGLANAHGGHLDAP
jgi:hypothetical protein